MKQHQEIVKAIRLTIRKPAAFRDATFSRKALASQIGIGETLLSKVINEEMGTTFLDLLNSQRAAYAYKLLTSEVHVNDPIEDIALLSGFTSRMSLHRCFTKIYGMTPGEARISTH